MIGDIDHRVGVFRHVGWEFGEMVAKASQR
ncbi:MAG: hypothetical protein ACI8WB_003868 [Phenylobacterium sp.]|jgi:hypothetical protein